MGGGVDASGGTALVPQGERDDDEDGVCSKGSNERRRKGAQCWEGWLLWGMAVMGVAGLVLVSARHQEFEPMLGYPGEGPSSANRKATRAQEDELRKQVQQESAVLEDVDTDDEWIDDMDNSSKSSLDTEVGAWQGDEMDREGVENNTTGTIGFFNVDGLQLRAAALAVCTCMV